MAIIIESTKKLLSSNAGLLLIDELIKKSSLEKLATSFLPKQKLGNKRNTRKFSNLILGFAAGTDCLDDMAVLNTDPAYATLTDHSHYHPKSYGDLLRSFSGENIYRMQGALIKLALNMRRTHIPKKQQNQIIFDCDSTLNRQYGKKMEGVECNYQNFEGLSTLNIFDQHGFQYLLEVRPGAMNTSYGIEDPIHRIMTEVTQQYRKEKTRPKVCFRADSGYYKVSFINACLAKKTDLIVAYRKDASLPKLLGQVSEWKKTDP